jgi:transcriptional regulator with GAF, ATPase, and Fis domain
MIISNNEILNLKHFTHSDIEAPELMSLENMERRHIQTILGMTCGRIKGPGGAAEHLGLNPSTLYSRMKKLNIKSLPQ